jgi:putative ABC transport system ATP-binding protein
VTLLVDALGLRRVYPMGASECVALHGVDLQIAPGEFVAIMGPSGSGKSTLMHLLGCLDRPTSGRYRLDGVEVHELDDRSRSRLRNRKVGFVFQSFNLIPELDVQENVELPLVYAGVPAAARAERAAALLDAVGLALRCRHRPHELSGGELQRAAIARALVHEPPLLLADEPTGNLDTETGAGILRLFASLHERGTTIVLVTHDPEVARGAQRVVLVRDGRIAADAPNGDGRQPPTPATWHEEA